MKKIISIILVFIMSISCQTVFAEYTPQGKDITVTYNGDKVDLGGAKAQNIDGFTMVPMRVIFELAGCKVSFDGNTKEVFAEKENYKLLLKIDSRKAMLIQNGKTEEKMLDIAPCIISDRTLVPVRFISESLGFIVNWNPNFKEVVIIDFANWEKRISESAINNLLFANFEKRDIYGGTVEVFFDFERALKVFGIEKKDDFAKNKKYPLTLIINNNFDIYLKSTGICDFFGLFINKQNITLLKDKYLKVTTSSLLASEMGINLDKKSCLWDALKETVLNDKFIYSSTVKNIDNLISFFECIRLSDDVKFIANRNIILPQGNKFVEFQNIFLTLK